MIRAALCAGLTLILLSLTILSSGESTMNAYEQYLADGTIPSIREQYADVFRIGVAVPAQLLRNELACQVIRTQFSSLSCEN